MKSKNTLLTILCLAAVVFGVSGLMSNARGQTSKSKKQARPEKVPSTEQQPVDVKGKWTDALEEARRDFMASNDRESAEFVSQILASLEQPEGLSSEALAANGERMKKKVRELVQRGVLESGARLDWATALVIRDLSRGGWPDAPVRSNPRNGGAPGPGGLVLYMPFDAPPVNSVVRDESGAGNEGRVEGAQWVSEGRYGGAYLFRITNLTDRIVVPDSDSLGVEYITLSAWIKSSDTDGFWNRIFDKNSFTGYHLSLGGDLKEHSRGMLSSSQAHKSVIADRSIGDGLWHHVAYTFDGKIRTLYVDGIEVKQVQTKSPEPIPRNHWDLCIGNSVVDQNGRFLAYDGLIDEVRIYNRTLTAGEINALATATKAGVNVGTATPVAESAPAERLKQAKQLSEQGLIDKETYDRKVKEITDSI